MAEPTRETIEVVESSEFDVEAVLADDGIDVQFWVGRNEETVEGLIHLTWDKLLTYAPKQDLERALWEREPM